MWKKLARLFGRSKFEADLDAEMRDHMAKYADDLVTQGVSREEAEWKARREFGFVSQLKEDVRAATGLAWADAAARHLRFGARVLRKNPVFALTAIATLALAIGANTAIFSVVDAMLFRPLPYPEPDRLGIVYTHVHEPEGVDYDQTAVRGVRWEFVRDRVTTLDVGLHRGRDGVNLVTPAGQAEFLQQMRVSAGFFRVIGVAPFLGREFLPEEDIPAGPAVVVLSHALWTRLFAADPSVVGNTILLRGEPFRVTGVMPEGFESAPAADLWTPVRPSRTGEGSGLNYTLVGRVRPEFSVAQAQSELAVLGQEFLTSVASNVAPGYSSPMRLVTLQDALGSRYRDQVLLLWAAVGVVLFIGCVNIAGVMLARAAARRHEIATRLALGSGRGGIVGQLLAESLLLALAGGALGLALGYMAVGALRPMLAVALEPAQQVVIDWRVLAATGAATLLTVLIFGLYPALAASRADLRTAMGTTSRTATSHGAMWTRRGLVIAEIALGMVLLVSAGLVLRTLTHLNGLSPGFDLRNVVTASVSLRDARYATQPPVLNLYDRSLEQIRNTPGVESAGVGLSLPYDTALNLSVTMQYGAIEERSTITNVTYGTPGYFDALRFRLAAGRWFDARDRSGAVPVVLINEAFARDLFRGENPLGRRVKILNNKEREVVGVVGDVQQSSNWGDFGPVGPARSVYLPAAQIEDNSFGGLHSFLSPQWVVRTAGPLPGLPQAMRAAIASVDPQLPIAGFRSMEDVRAGRFALQRLESSLLGALAGLALLLAAIGIYGLIANAVVERTREFGIRLALGCPRWTAVAQAARSGVALTVAGLATGYYLALQAGQWIRSVLIGVQADDHLTFAAVTATLLVVAILASLLPSLRIVRIDPARTLREE